jgi:hypothetical protein
MELLASATLTVMRRGFVLTLRPVTLKRIILTSAYHIEIRRISRMQGNSGLQLLTELQIARCSYEKFRKIQPIFKGLISLESVRTQN